MTLAEQVVAADVGGQYGSSDSKAARPPAAELSRSAIRLDADETH